MKNKNLSHNALLECDEHKYFLIKSFDLKDRTRFSMMLNSYSDEELGSVLYFVETQGFDFIGWRKTLSGKEYPVFFVGKNIDDTGSDFVHRSVYIYRCLIQ